MFTPDATGSSSRRRLRRTAWAVLPMAAVLLAAGCGGGDDNKDKGSTSAVPTPPAMPSMPQMPSMPGMPSMPETPGASGASTPGAPGGGQATFDATQKTIADNWQKFFDKGTPIPQRVSLLQDGDKLGDLVNGLSSNPMISQVSAQVSNVVVNSDDNATVTFTVLLAGSPVASDIQGVAVKQGGTWKIGAKTVCSLTSLAGVTAPAVCANYT